MVDRDWNEIQNDHNNGMLLNEIMSKYAVSRTAISTASRHGLFEKVKHKRCLTKEQKEVLSVKRTVHDYCYGWELDQVEGQVEGVDYVEGGSHSLLQSL